MECTTCHGTRKVKELVPKSWPDALLCDPALDRETLKRMTPGDTAERVCVCLHCGGCQ